MALELDGVVDVIAAADLVVHGGPLWGKLTPSLLPGLGAPSSWAVEAATGGVAPASTHRRGMSNGAIPVGSGR